MVSHFTQKPAHSFQTNNNDTDIWETTCIMTATGTLSKHNNKHQNSTSFRITPGTNRCTIQAKLATSWQRPRRQSTLTKFTLNLKKATFNFFITYLSIFRLQYILNQVNSVAVTPLIELGMIREESKSWFFERILTDQQSWDLRHHFSKEQQQQEHRNGERGKPRG